MKFGAVPAPSAAAHVAGDYRIQLKFFGDYADQVRAMRISR